MVMVIPFVIYPIVYPVSQRFDFTLIYTAGNVLIKIYFHKVEELAETELYYCNSCKCKQKSTKRFWVRRLPNVLCLHIKRFRWNNFFRTKIDQRIKFPIKSLDMSQYILNNVPETRRSNLNSNVYDLAAVIVHHGNG